MQNHGQYFFGAAIPPSPSSVNDKLRSFAILGKSLLKNLKLSAFLAFPCNWQTFGMVLQFLVWFSALGRLLAFSFCFSGVNFLKENLPKISQKVTGNQKFDLRVAKASD